MPISASRPPTFRLIRSLLWREIIRNDPEPRFARLRRSPAHSSTRRMGINVEIRMDGSDLLRDKLLTAARFTGKR